MPKPRHIAVLGSTGSVGEQALEVMEAHADHFVVEVLTANNNADRLIEQARAFRPNTVVIANEAHYAPVKEALEPENIKVFTGADALAQVVAQSDIDLVLTALVGYAGLRPTLCALEAGKAVALANKETLVVAGELVTRTARENQAPLLPVDSEHSAIFQCLMGEAPNPVEKIYLTASGGPFRGKKTADLHKVTPKQALDHPNWDMGAKITIDSATMMNKGLEVIEARWLFDLKPPQIDVVVHPQSVIHSIVQFEDGSMKAQMGDPDMRVPIQFALSYPTRLKSAFPRFNFVEYPKLTFEAPDKKTFRNLSLAYRALEKGGTLPCVLNAANEVAVQAFLDQAISFTAIPDAIEAAMNETPFVPKPGYTDYVKADKEARRMTTAYMASGKVAEK